MNLQWVVAHGGSARRSSVGFTLKWILTAIVFFLPSQMLIAADITWNITYDDVGNSTGVGFDDATFGAARRATFQAVLDYINTVVDESGVVDLIVTDSLVDGTTGPLAISGPLFFSGPNGFQNGWLFDHATTGVDPWVGLEDATATFDFGFTWNSELDSPTVGEIDLFSIALHEVTHSMGYLSLLFSDGTGLNGTDPDVFSVFDSFLELGDGTLLFNGAPGDFTGVPGDLISDDVFFGGPNATAANGGLPVQIYAPSPFDSSSLSHNDFGGVMDPFIVAGVEVRQYSAFEIGILQDLGYSLESQAIPEPSTFLLFAVGSLLLLFVMGRRRRALQAKPGYRA